jgi:hypothetical protein
MPSDQRPPDWVVLLLALTTMIVGLISGHHCGRYAMQVEAVKHNAARWDVTQEGRTKFMWNAPPNIEL